jgi:sporulation protein YlmC with PRC-barrel domain
MAKQRIHIEHLLGRKVIDQQGKPAGRIEEIQCQPSTAGDGRTVVTDYLLGRGGLLERLSISTISLALVGFLGAHKGAGTHRVPWEKMDLADPHHPRLKCGRDDLQSA